jgi:decaprenylphospho-beta-D-ribofuranose 2-oxidase
VSATPDPLAGIPSRMEELHCYSELYSTKARVLYPQEVDQLRRIFDYARTGGHRVTLRAGGHSFDAQSLGTDVVVSMTSFDGIEVHRDQRTVRVGPGATWGSIVAKLKRNCLMPAITVTTEHATAGGTLSGDCLSRFSPAYGKEGTWVKGFELLTTDGRLLRCTPPRKHAPPSQWTDEERAFCGVIGGLGYLGAVVAITYRVLSVGECDGRIGVRTKVCQTDTFAGLAKALVPITQKMVSEDSDPTDERMHDAIYSAMAIGRDGREQTLLFTSTITTSHERHPMALYQPKRAMRIVVEWLMRVPFFCSLIWRFAFRFLYKNNSRYVDDLDGFTFFLDGNTRAKRLGRRLGFKMATVQQTFVVPSHPVAEGGWDKSRDDLVEWLEDTHEFLQQRDLTPTLQDVLYLPKDLPFLMSASADRAGFAVSYAFETSKADTLARAEAAFVELADVLWTRFGGRVYLVKNVFAKQATLADMYGDNAREFFRLKRELDPDAILCNDFLERTFGDLV